MSKEARGLSRFLGRIARGKGNLAGRIPVEPGAVQRGAKRLQEVVGRRQAQAAQSAASRAADRVADAALKERKASKLEAVRRGMGKGQVQPKPPKAPATPGAKTPVQGPEAARPTAAPAQPKAPKPKKSGVKRTLLLGGGGLAAGSALTGAGAGGTQAAMAPQAPAQTFPPGY